MTTTKSKLGEALASGKLAITAECLPPQGGDAAAVKKLSSLLPANLDAVVVADNPGATRGSALACAAMLAAEGRPSVLSMVTRDRNRIALESDAHGAAALGVGGLVEFDILRQDRKYGGSYAESTSAGGIMSSFEYRYALSDRVALGLKATRRPCFAA